MQPLTVMIQPYVKKWVKSVYGKEPVYLRSDGDLGKIIFLAFSKDYTLPLTSVDLVVDMVGVDKAKMGFHKLKLAVSFPIAQSKITSLNIERICIAIENEFEKAMYFYALAARDIGLSERQAVKMFLHKYKIHEDILKEDTAVKMAQRKREKMEGRE